MWLYLLTFKVLSDVKRCVFPEDFKEKMPAQVRYICDLLFSLSDFLTVTAQVKWESFLSVNLNGRRLAVLQTQAQDLEIRVNWQFQYLNSIVTSRLWRLKQFCVSNSI